MKKNFDSLQKQYLYLLLSRRFFCVFISLSDQFSLPSSNGLFSSCLISLAFSPRSTQNLFVTPHKNISSPLTNVSTTLSVTLQLAPQATNLLPCSWFSQDVILNHHHGRMVTFTTRLSNSFPAERGSPTSNENFLTPPGWCPQRGLQVGFFDLW